MWTGADGLLSRRDGVIVTLRSQKVMGSNGTIANLIIPFPTGRGLCVAYPRQ
jgi:hypothetical protein